MITEQQKKEYVESNYGKCPYCKSESIEGGSVDVEGRETWQKVSCSDCEKEWHDVYTLSSIEEIE